MKVAFLSYYNGIYERGVETLVPQIATRLGKDHEVVVFQSGNGNGKNYKTIQITSDWKPKKIEPILNLRKRLFLDPDSLAILEFTRKIIPILRKEKFDVIVPWNNGWQTILCKFFNVGKVVVVGQSGLGWDDRINLYLFPDCFVGFTKAQINWARRVNPLVKTEVIPNGVDLKKFRPEGQEIKINLPRPIILCAAALVVMKRQHLAIKAVAQLKTGSLLLLGKGELKDKLEELGNKLLPGRFKIMESQYSEIDKIYRSVDLFTFPTSFYESFGIVQLEAMATNLPLVVNDDPIRREIVGDAGFVVNPENTQEYANTLEKALNTRWGSIPQKRAEDFSYDLISEKYKKLFEEIAK